MQKVGILFLSLLFAATANAEPLPSPEDRVNHLRVVAPIVFVTNVNTDHPMRTTLQRAMDRLNGYLEEPIMSLADERLEGHMHAIPFLSTITIASRNTFVDILGFFGVKVLGKAGLIPIPLYTTQGRVGKVWLLDKYDTDHMRDYVVLHELLHAAGVPHTAEPDDIMYPMYSPNAKVTTYTLHELYKRYTLKPVFEELAEEHIIGLGFEKGKKPDDKTTGRQGPHDEPVTCGGMDAH